MKKSILICWLILTSAISMTTFAGPEGNNPTDKKSTSPYPYEEEFIEVMFDANSQVRLRSGDLIDLKTSALNGVDNLLSDLNWYTWSRICDVPESVLDNLQTQGEANTAKPVYNLNNIYRLQIPPGNNVWELSNELEKLSGIHSARPVPKPMELPLPPDYQPNQNYEDPAVSTPTGTDAEYAWTQTGGDGSGVTVCDLEYSWNYNHSDVTKAFGSQINTNVVDPFNDFRHGTAVIGELVSDNNSWGTKGACYGASLKTCGTYFGNPATWNVPGALAVAIANLSAGDVILIEQQWDYTGSGGYVPIEWWTDYYPNAQTNNSVYAAIVNAIANGINVVEAGGNGDVDTDLMSWYGNSGAIIVGAGGAYTGGTYTAGDLQRLSFSSYGSRFDLQGWGENVVTTGYGDYYNSEGVNLYYTNTFSGTSSASPIVAAAVASSVGYWLANISGTPPTPNYIRNVLVNNGTPQITPPSGNIGPRPDLLATFAAMQPQYNYDWGDAPDPTYPTLNLSNGANHLINGLLFLGAQVDAEPDGQPDINAMGDDNDIVYPPANDDEDGVVFTSPLIPGQNATVTVTASMQGILNAWIDFDISGNWPQSNEHIFIDQALNAGPNYLTFTVPTSALPGYTYARFRFSSTTGIPFYGPAPDGEVEDYFVFIEEQQNDVDWGDAPDAPYPTLAASNGANHYIDGVTFLGGQVDAEPDGIPDPNALGDDNTGVSDEDGVVFTSQILVGQNATVDVIASVPGILNAWIDFDQNGSWADPSDFIFMDFPLNPGVNSLNFMAPASAIPGQSFARFRFSSQAGLSFTGTASDGEVEDYEVVIEDQQGDYKWEQLPDLSDTGLDVDATYDMAGMQPPHILADDYLCTETGPVTTIKVWGSWLHDHIPFFDDPSAVEFTLSFHGDVPVGPGNPFSHPDSTLWYRTFLPGEFMVELYEDNLYEGWFDPITGLYEPFGDSQCWLYTFNIDPTEAFVQLGTPDSAIVYWLDVQAQPYDDDPECRFGWKTTLDNWNDDAVWGDGVEPYPGPWQELLYPAGHPLEGQSIDLAFALKGEDMPDEYDWGDAPDPTYPTYAATNGANHFIDGITYLGTGIDADSDGQPDPFALGDDNDGNDDEDGVAFMNPLVPGNTVGANVVASTAGILNAWFDYNDDGDWADGNEHVFVDVSLISGTNTLNFTVPSTAVQDSTFCRFRFSTLAGLNFDGSASDGEVEDYVILIESEDEFDWGDAADPTYPTLSASNGANHLLDGATYLGAGVDPETDGQPDPNALGDDNDGNDDEDGIVFNQIMTGSPAQLMATTSVAGYLQGWMDFNADGDWSDPGEQIFTDEYIHFGYSVCLNYSVPVNANLGTTYARFRFSTVAGLSYTGTANDGEVEDYEVQIVENPDIKWLQEPCTELPGLHAHDYYQAGAYSYIVLADDWQCHGGLVTDIHWFGNYELDALGQEKRGQGINFFHLSIHANDTSNCLPIEPEIWGVNVPFATANEINTGLVNSENGIIYEYEYILDIPFDQQEGMTYWLDISAYANDPNDPAIWRWQESDRSTVPILCPAANKDQSTPWQSIVWSTPLPPRFSDMAFSITSEDFDLMDWGDAPDPSYPTLAASNGANHIVDGVTYLGAGVDVDSDGQQDPNALGDDNDGNDDEDGIVFNQIMTGSPAQLMATTDTAGFLQGWMDFNGDGDWADPGEQIFTDEYINPFSFAGETVCLNYSVPANADTGTTYARFRFSTVPGLTYTGLASDGEVEDYEVQIIANPDIKWLQEPCTELPGLHAHDFIMPPDTYWYTILADDWQCNGGMVTDIHWYGNYELDAAGQELRGQGINYFHLSIHANDPSNCLPLDPEIWGIDVPFATTNEANTGLVNSENCIIYEYEYYLDIPFDQQEGMTYWLDITAVANDPNNAAVWRWQESDRSTVPILCPAASKDPATPWQPINWTSNPPTCYSDMAFSITSEDIDLMDWGDAPDPTYPTLSVNNGASHLIDSTLYLGTTIDSEFDGQPDANATGDDNDGNNDDDGVVFMNQLVPGGSVALNVTATGSGNLNAWIDYNGDGDWADSNEHVFVDAALSAGSNLLIFAVPAGAVQDTTFCRFRYSTTTGLSYDGSAPDGEVEDYEVVIESTDVYDWGDAPDPSYPTLSASNGANHLMDGVTYLGAGVDADANGQPDPNAMGDDNDGNDDEDGIAFTSVFIPGQTATMSVTASVNGVLNAWMDFNINGSWADAGEQIFVDEALAAGVNNLTITVPTWAVSGQSIARFRFSTTGGLPYDGPANDGEVEDYQFDIQPLIEYKWEQFPDLSPEGLDVDATYDLGNFQPPHILADDFECNITGPLNEIYVWGSWYQDILPFGDPSAVQFTLSIHEDIPASQSGTGYSMPGNVLWYRTFDPGEFAVMLFADNLIEGYYDPVSGQYDPFGDTQCWQYIFNLDPGEFVQQGTPDEPVVYWLDVQATPLEALPEIRFGWKTSPMHWNDNAVYGVGVEPYPGPWSELYYPAGHPLEGTPIDLAFGITGEEDPHILLDLTVFLEGPYNGFDMNPDLNSNNYLPLDQPYNVAPWNYSGAQSVSSIPNANVIDWVIVEIRETPYSADSAKGSTKVGEKAIFLLKDGSVKSTDGSSLPKYYLNPVHNLYVVVWHRNHLGVLSQNPLSMAGGNYVYDFSTGIGQAFGGVTGHKDIGGGVYGMIAGDGDASGQIDNTDKNVIWFSQAGSSGYLGGDFNMNGQADNTDKNVVWLPNSGSGSQVPDNINGGYQCQVPE